VAITVAAATSLTGASGGTPAIRNACVMTVENTGADTSEP